MGLDNQNMPKKRAIPKGYAYNPKALKPLAKSLFASSVALGHTIAAYKHFSRLKSATVSPDGLVGGRGYIMSVDEIRKKLFDASEALSSIADALYDEITAPHWQPKLAQLGKNDAEDVSRFIEEAEKVLDEPGGGADKEIRKIEEENDKPKKVKKAVYSVPRVDTRSPGEGSGPLGSFNFEEDAPSDGFGSGVRDYDYTSYWENVVSSTIIQDMHLKDMDTPVEAQDFGLGYGAKGQASLNLGDVGPRSMLPNDNLGPVVRSDYYRGNKGNLVNSGDTSLAGTSYIYEDPMNVRLPLGWSDLDPEEVFDE